MSYLNPSLHPWSHHLHHLCSFPEEHLHTPNSRIPCILPPGSHLASGHPPVRSTLFCALALEVGSRSRRCSNSISYSTGRSFGIGISLFSVSCFRCFVRKNFVIKAKYQSWHRMAAMVILRDFIILKISYLPKYEIFLTGTASIFQFNRIHKT